MMAKDDKYYRRFPLYLNSRYFRWLCTLVDLDEDYLFLASELYKHEFIATIPNDENRVYDGKTLRYEYQEFTSLSYVDMKTCYASSDDPCTMLELMVGIAKRMEFQTGQEFKKWFWVMLSNLGLDFYTDDGFYSAGGTRGAVKILDRISELTYTKDGLGGLFPLNNTSKDMRRVELWYQMHSYLAENYEF